MAANFMLEGAYEFISIDEYYQATNLKDSNAFVCHIFLSNRHPEKTIHVQVSMSNKKDNKLISVYKIHVLPGVKSLIACIELDLWLTNPPYQFKIDLAAFAD